MRVPLNIETHEMDPVISSLTTAITQTVDENKDSLQAAFVNIKASGDLNLLHSRSLESLLEAFTASIANTRNAAAKNRLSDSLKSAVIDALTSCNDASGSLFKQPTLMGPETEQKASRTFASSITSFVDAYTQLFHCYAGIIHQNEPKLQDEHLHSPNTKELAAKAHRATQEASSLQSSPENKNSPQTADISLPIRQHEDPPPYPEDRSVKVTISYGRGSPADSGNGGSSKTYDLAAPFRALAKAFCSKSQPFVPALCEAAVQGDLNNVAALISQGVNVNGTNEDGDTALDLAIQRNHLHIVSILLAAGADPTRQGRRGLPPLFKAVIKGHYEIAEMLQRYGAKPNAADVTGQPFIMDVVASGTVAGVQYLLEHGVGGNVKDITGEQAIVKAVRRGDVDMAAVLLKHGAKITAKDITGQPLLAIALENKDANMVDLLLSQGANPNGKDITGSSLLCVACGKYKKCPELVHLLLKYGANANSKTVTGTSVFSDAVTSRHLDLARCLLESGANPNATEVTGQPILITVICDKKIGQKDKVELVRLMLERGCNPNKARDFVFGEKAIDIARRAGNLEIVALLEKYS